MRNFGHGIILTKRTDAEDIVLKYDSAKYYPRGLLNTPLSQYEVTGNEDICNLLQAKFGGAITTESEVILEINLSKEIYNNKNPFKWIPPKECDINAVESFISTYINYKETNEKVNELKHSNEVITESIKFLKTAINAKVKEITQQTQLDLLVAPQIYRDDYLEEANRRIESDSYIMELKEQLNAAYDTKHQQEQQLNKELKIQSKLSNYMSEIYGVSIIKNVLYNRTALNPYNPYSISSMIRYCEQFRETDVEKLEQLYGIISKKSFIVPPKNIRTIPIEQQSELLKRRLDAIAFEYMCKAQTGVNVIINQNVVATAIANVDIEHQIMKYGKVIESIPAVKDGVTWLLDQDNRSEYMHATRSEIFIIADPRKQQSREQAVDFKYTCNVLKSLGLIENVDFFVTKATDWNELEDKIKTAITTPHDAKITGIGLQGVCPYERAETICTKPNESALEVIKNKFNETKLNLDLLAYIIIENTHGGEKAMKDFVKTACWIRDQEEAKSCIKDVKKMMDEIRPKESIPLRLCSFLGYIKQLAYEQDTQPKQEQLVSEPDDIDQDFEDFGDRE